MLDVFTGLGKAIFGSKEKRKTYDSETIRMCRSRF